MLYGCTVVTLVKSAGRSGGTGSRQLAVPLCTAAFYGCVMVCTVSARLRVFLCVCVRVCLDRLYNHRDVCCRTRACACVCVHSVQQQQFPARESECDYYGGINVSRL